MPTFPKLASCASRELGGVFVYADHVERYAVFGSVGVFQGSAGTEGEGFAAVGAAELGIFDGVVLAGAAGGRGGDADCHNEASYGVLYTAGVVEKR